MSEQASAAVMADEYLRKISAYLRSSHPEDSFRTCVDGWFAHEADPGTDLWLNLNSKKRDKHRWLNKPRIDFIKRRRTKWHVSDSFYAMHFQSTKFHALVERKRNREPFELPRDWVVKDHSVPLLVLREFLRKYAHDLTQLRTLLRRHYHIAAITKDEDRLLDKAKLRARMPTEDWHERPFARYEAVGIQHHSLRQVPYRTV